MNAWWSGKTAWEQFRFIAWCVAGVALLVAFVATTTLEWVSPLGWPRFAETSTPFKDAMREIGGAVISGAVLALLVVWYERRREERAAQDAWLREVDLRLLAVLTGELSAARRDRFKGIVSGNEGWSYVVYRETFRVVENLLRFVDDDDVQLAWRLFREATNLSEEARGGDPVDETREIALLLRKAFPGADPEGTVPANWGWIESQAFERLLRAHDEYVSRRYDAPCRTQTIEAMDRIIERDRQKRTAEGAEKAVPSAVPSGSSETDQGSGT